jgi:hypothetical protein
MQRDINRHDASRFRTECDIRGTHTAAQVTDRAIVDATPSLEPVRTHCIAMLGESCT